MPLYVIFATDRPETLAIRLEHYTEHRAYNEEQEGAGVKTVFAGPLQTDDGEAMNGSLIVVDAPDRATVERYVANDPFRRYGVWGEVKISRFHRRKG
jgi:uncharacterized protein YciI